MFTRHCALDLCWSTIFSENRVPLFRIMLWDQARRRSPPRLRVFLLRLEDVAIEDRRDTQVRYVDQLRDVEIDGHAYHRIGLFAAQPFSLTRKSIMLSVALRAARLTSSERLASGAIFWPPR